MTPDLKQKLHKLIDTCNDEFLLEEARAVLESPQSGQDFFDELDEEDRDTFLEAEEEHEKGHSATHNRLMHQFEAWKKKWSLFHNIDFDLLGLNEKTHGISRGFLFWLK